MQNQRYIVSEKYFRGQQEVLDKAQADLTAISDAIMSFQANGHIDEDTLLNLIDLAARDIKNLLATLNRPF